MRCLLTLISLGWMLGCGGLNLAQTKIERISLREEREEETRQEWANLSTVEEAEMRLRLYQEGMPFREP